MAKSNNHPPTDQEVSEVFRAMARRRWKKTTKAERSAIASKTSSAISPEAAKARAQKAWETKRRNARKAKT